MNEKIEYLVNDFYLKLGGTLEAVHEWCENRPIDMKKFFEMYDYRDEEDKELMKKRISRERQLQFIQEMVLPRMILVN